MDLDTITISLDQRTLALYGVGHADYAKKLIDALRGTVATDRHILIVAGSGADDDREYDDAVLMVTGDGVDAGRIRKVAAEVWASLPKTVTIGDTTCCITQNTAEPQIFAVTVQTRPDYPLFSGPWTAVRYWLRRSRAQGVA
ncbi:hypothetical protein GCT19_09485 [Paraburkholderia sp. CNPSo 3155]|uniref:hypothetical protein n=1 Tax=Paraburkholderia atlantica TaxID=2654982 RepID=UPI00128C1A72|nr:hypothetical protein [Paraburkholderia atlantica]MPW05875.1 hypothetical protein [Paraburkholderia atlantica]